MPECEAGRHARKGDQQADGHQPYQPHQPVVAGGLIDGPVMGVVAVAR